MRKIEEDHVGSSSGRPPRHNPVKGSVGCWLVRNSAARTTSAGVSRRVCGVASPLKNRKTVIAKKTPVHQNSRSVCLQREAQLDGVSRIAASFISSPFGSLRMKKPPGSATNACSLSDPKDRCQRNAFLMRDRSGRERMPVGKRISFP